MMRYDSTYSILEALNRELGGTQSVASSEYEAVINLMSTISGEEFKEGTDVFEAVSTVVTKIEGGDTPDIPEPPVDPDTPSEGGCRLRTLYANENGNYKPDETFDGWHTVVVDVPTQFSMPSIDYLGLDHIDENGLSFRIKMSEGNPSWLNCSGCPYFDCNLYIDEGDGVFRFDIEGSCEWESPYWEIYNVNKPIDIDGVECTLTSSIWLRIDFV